MQAEGFYDLQQQHLTANFSRATVGARRQCNELFKLLKGLLCIPKMKSLGAVAAVTPFKSEVKVLFLAEAAVFFPAKVKDTGLPCAAAARATSGVCFVSL